MSETWAPGWRGPSAWIRAQTNEIASDPALRVYGALLALTHGLTFATWQLEWRLADLLSADAVAVCWPFFERCADFRFLDASGLAGVLWSYAALSLATCAIFGLGPRRTGLAWVALLLLEILKAAIVFQDFRLRLNQHYMAGMASLAFLFLPRKREALRLLIVLFYFWAGALKLNREWLSGSALYHQDRFWIQGALLPWACAYVVVLEMAVSFGLLARRAWVFWPALFQFAAFHVFSWPVVGFFYPTLMFLLLALYLLCRWIPTARADLSAGDLFRGRAAASSWALIVGFSALQLIPVAIPGDSALTGEGRIFAVHMFDAKIECEADYVLTESNGNVRHLEPSGVYAPRIRCDPLLHWNYARHLCREAAKVSWKVRLDLHLSSRHSDESELRPVIAIQDFCVLDPGYRTLWHNDWILLSPP